MNDIAERMRAQTEGGNLLLLREAAAEIKRLRAENAELRARIDEGLPTADDVRGILRAMTREPNSYRYAPEEIGELNQTIDRLRAEVERLTALVQNVSGTRDTAVNMKLERDAEIAHLTAQCIQASTAYMYATNRAEHYEAEVRRLRAAIRTTASEGSYNEMAIRKAVSFELAELIVNARAALESTP